MKKFLLIVAVPTMTACGYNNSSNSAEPNTTETVSAEQRYSERIHTRKVEAETNYNGALHRSANMKDCVYEYIDCKDCDKILNVVRCPNSSTTTEYRDNKSTASITVQDGASPQ